jgi:protoheme IX farnesyltransferase
MMETMQEHPLTELRPLELAVEVSHSRLLDFYELTKPRMNFLVVVTTVVGFYMASVTNTNWLLLFNTIFGTALTAAAAAVLNQLMERRIDALMPRTRNRPLPAGRVSPREAAIYGLSLGVIGVGYLAILVNPLTAALGAFTLLSYLFIYTPMKRVSSLNTIIGAVPGAIPPMMGFTAVENALSPGAWVLFAILFLWQMPHFLAIASIYRDDYAAGGFKMLPVVDHELSMTCRMIIFYTLALIPITLLGTVLKIAGVGYLIVAALMGLGFLWFGIRMWQSRNRSAARQLFFASIIYLPLLLAAMMIDKL